MSSKRGIRVLLAAVVAGVLPACGNINDGHPPVPFTILASQSTAGDLANDSCLRPALSGDGRFVVFATLASTLVPEDLKGHQNVFRRNLQTGVTQLVSIGLGGAAADGDSDSPSISGD